MEKYINKNGLPVGTTPKELFEEVMRGTGFVMGPTVSIFKENVVVQDEYGNLIKSDYASYDNKLQKLNIRGNITVQTSEGYNIDASEIELDKKSKFILSKTALSEVIIIGS